MNHLLRGARRSRRIVSIPCSARCAVEPLDPRLHLARPEPSLAENVFFRLPLAVDSTTHYYYDRNEDAPGSLAWNNTSQSYNGHNGTDYSGGPRGKPVFAAADGILIAKVDGLPDGDINTPGNGNYVRINHGNDRSGRPINTVYLHFNAGTVTTKPLNSFIASGEQIGGVGTSGHSTGLHLHFETQLARAAFDPFKAIGSSETSWWTNQGSGTPSTQSNGPKLKVGDTVQTYELVGDTLSVRATPAASASLGTRGNGATGTVLEGPTYAAFNNDYNNSLWVWYRVQWSDGLTGWSVQNWLRKPVDATVPAITSAAFEREQLPQKVSVGFSEDVGASIASGDLVVTRFGSGVPLAGTTMWDAATRTATMAFDNRLMDGRYRLRIAASAVSDGGGNGLAADFNHDFHVFAGDANGDAKVNFDDLLIFGQNYAGSGKTFSQGNFDYDSQGLVDFDDLLILSQRYGTSIVSTELPARPTAAKSRRAASSVLG